MAKKIVGFVKLQVPAGKANPSPPIGPALGQRGLNIMEFCKAFNAQTQDQDAGRHWIESSCVPDLARASQPANPRNDIVRRPFRRLVDDQQAVGCVGQGSATEGASAQTEIGVDRISNVGDDLKRVASIGSETRRVAVSATTLNSKIKTH